VVVEWSDGNGLGTARFRSRGVSVSLDEDLLQALREVLGTEGVELVKAG
jgi:hypothetical protein